MKVLVTGSRVYGNYEKVKEAIIQAKATIVIHGHAKGADALASRACRELGLEEHRYPANWEKFGRGAGPKRNQQMLDEEHKSDDPIEMVLAFPIEGSIGTVDMMMRAGMVNIPIVVCS